MSICKYKQKEKDHHQYNMDYEDILFGLQPILNANSIKDVPIQDVYLQSYITVMDQLAVSLRAPQNRDLVRETGLLTQILRVLEDTLDVAIHEPDNINNLKYWQLASELIRCVANCLVDNNINRKILLKVPESSPIPAKVSKNPLLDYYMIKILTFIEFTDQNEDTMRAVQLRSIVLLRNLVLENNAYAIRIAKVILGPLLTYLRYSEHTFHEEPDNMVLALDLLLEFTKEISTGYSLDSLLFLTRFCKRIATVVESIPQENENENDDEGPTVGDEPPEEDPYSEMLFSLSESIEVVVLQQDNFIDFESSGISKVQTELFITLSVLNGKFFANKLIVMRRLVSITGNISAIPTNTNINDRPLCYEVIKESQDGYTIAAALIILSNSINSKDDATTILKEITLDDVINVAQYIKDPLEFQGYLDLLRKLINLSNAMFLSQTSVTKFFSILSHCSEQAQFFPNLSELIDRLLKKSITVLPSNSLFNLLDQEDNNNFMVKFICNRGSFVSCLLMDKLLVAKKETSPDALTQLWDTIFKIEDTGSSNQSSNTNGISIPFLFQLTKTIGIYLHNCVTTPLNENEPNIVFTTYFNPIAEIMNIIIPLKTNTDKGSESVYNNGKFIAGMIQKLLSTVEVKTPEETKLSEITYNFFNDN